MPSRWLCLGALAVASAAVAGPVRFEAGPGCAEAVAFDGVVTQPDWSLSLQPEGAGWRLELSRGGQRALVRALPAASSCAALRQAVQLIIERYFREVAAGRAVAPPPAEVPRHAAEGTPPTPSSEADERRASTPAPRAAAAASEPAARSASTPRLDAVAPPAASANEPGARGPSAPRAEAVTPTGASMSDPGARSDSTPPIDAVAPPTPSSSEPAARSAADRGSPTGAPSSDLAARATDRVAPTAAPTRSPSNAPHPSPRIDAVAPAAAPATVAEAPAPPPLLSSTAPAPEPAAPRLERRLELSAGGGALGAFGPSATDGGAFATAHAALRLGSLFRVGLLGGFANAATRDATVNGASRGTAWAVPFVVAAEAGACGPWPVELCAAAVAGVRGARGSAFGDRIFHKSEQWLVRPDLGLLARAQWRPWRGFFVALEAWAAFPLGGGSLEVDGIPSASIGLPVADVTGTLQLGWSWQIL